MDGRPLHAGYTVSHIRFDLGVFGIKQPNFALENKHFTIFSSELGVKVDYLLRKNRGVFFGLQSDYATDKIRLKRAKERNL